MCGIAGIVSNRHSNEELVRTTIRMADTLEHRGPDSSGVWHSNKFPVHLSHRRLAIQDLSDNGNQPMVSTSLRRVISYNGEIFNFRSIAKQLRTNGVSLRGHSDTEVILESIEHWGLEQTLEKIDGQFAFALWDELEGSLTLVRDRIGEKPLYYGVIDGQFLFASELKAIYSVKSPKSLTIDETALASYLRYGYISAPYSIFKEIRKLEPGTKACVKVADWHRTNKRMEDCVSTTPYWKLSEISGSGSKYREDQSEVATSDFEQILMTVISEQAISDVQLGSFLSGGIDSTLVTTMLQRNCARAIDTFTVGFNQKEFDEAVWAKKIAKHLGTSHHELYISNQDTLDIVPELPEIFDEPFSDSSQIPTYLVSKFARSKLTVCLSGDGGDELFAGYNRYIQGAKLSRLQEQYPTTLLHIAAKAMGVLTPNTWSQLHNAWRFLSFKKGGANFGSKVHKAANLLTINDPESMYRFLCSYWQEPSHLLSRTSKISNLRTHLKFKEDFISAGMAWDQQWYLPGDNLVKTDRAGMANSLETRVPLLDRKLIEFAWKLPLSMKYRDGQSKWLMRKLLYKHVPRSLIDRPKMGFSVPIDDWIRNSLREWCEALLTSTALNKHGLFNQEKIRKVLNSHLSKSTNNGNQLWTILMFQAWYNRYME